MPQFDFPFPRRYNTLRLLGYDYNSQGYVTHPQFYPYSDSFVDFGASSIDLRILKRNGGVPREGHPYLEGFEGLLINDARASAPCALALFEDPGTQK